MDVTRLAPHYAPPAPGGHCRRSPTLRMRAAVRRGFTLIEAAMVTVIIGVGVVAMLTLLAAGTRTNVDAAELSTGINLAGNIHEYSLRLPYAQVFTLDNQTYSPPKDARLQDIANMTGWSQEVQVNYVDPDRITLTVPDSQVEPTARITVTVKRNGQTVYATHWLKTDN